MNWTKEAWAKASKIYGKILEHPFIKELAAGTLDINRFNRYLAQDEIYIGNYGRQMFAFNDLIKDPEQHAMFNEFAKSGIEGEKAMHELLIGRFGIDTEVKASIVTKTYNDHTQEAIDTGDKAVALAALLPCMWVYNEVGMHILKTANNGNNPYKEWIEEYGNEAFTEGVNSVLKLADEYAAQADEATRERMTREYVEATLYEYAFWDYGYYGEDKDYSYMNDTSKW